MAGLSLCAVEVQGCQIVLVLTQNRNIVFYVWRIILVRAMLKYLTFLIFLLVNSFEKITKLHIWINVFSISLIELHNIFWQPCFFINIHFSKEFEVVSSVTRLGNFLDFGQLLKPLVTINFPKSPTFLGNVWKCVKINDFSREIIFGQLL